MTKIKWVLISFVVLAGIGGAFASKPADFCETLTQYYKFGNAYLPAGEYGVDYYCLGTVGTCTYYLSDPSNPNSYVPCRTGTFNFINLKK